MNLSQIETDLKTHFEQAKTAAETFLGQHLPELASIAEHAEANPLVDAAMSAVHLSPEILNALAETVKRADAALAALQPAPVEPPAAPEPADGTPAEGVPVEAPADAAVAPQVTPVTDQ